MTLIDPPPPICCRGSCPVHLTIVPPLFRNMEHVSRGRSPVFLLNIHLAIRNAVHGQLDILPSVILTEAVKIPCISRVVSRVCCPVLFLCDLSQAVTALWMSSF